MTNMNKKELISVIIPVHNTSLYIKKCIESLITQNYDEIEIILIDDGSTDESSSICDMFLDVDSRITVVHQCNSGVSVSRNNGVMISRGVLISFVDGDDFVPRNAFSILQRIMIEKELEMVCGSWKVISPLRTIDHYNEEYVTKTSDKEKLAEYLEIDEINGPVAKLYYKSIIDDYKIRFDPTILIGEDAVFNYKYIKQCRKVGIISDIVYIYNKLNMQSVTHIYNEDYMYWNYTALNEQLECLKSGRESPSPFTMQKTIITRFARTIQYIIYYRSFEEAYAVKKCEEAFHLFMSMIDFNSLQFIEGMDREKRIVEMCRNNQYDKIVEMYKDSGEQKNLLSLLKISIIRFMAKIKMIYYFN